MNSLSIILRFIAGIALGIFFYGGLWLAIRRLPESRHPVLLTVCSFWVRTLVVLGGFFFLMDSHWEYTVTTIIGFTFGRIFIGRWKPRLKCI